MRIGPTLLLAAGLVVPAAPATARLCALDVVPSATLLLPYFAVDVGKLNRPQTTETTTLHLLNATPNDTIVRVTLWTDLSVPTMAFDLFLPGFDAEEIAVHELFRGNLPPDRVPPNLNNALCGPDGLTNPKHLQDAHTGQPVAAYGGRCAGFAHGGRIARGYITVDNVNRCDDIFPPDDGYFGSVGAAKSANQLTGQVRNQHRQYAEIEPLVHLEAGSPSAIGKHTFYGRYVGFDGSDQREPLAIDWSAHYELGTSSTTLEVWRDSGAVQGPFQCDKLGKEGWYPLDESTVRFFNQAAEVPSDTICAFDSALGQNCFPLESGAYALGRGKLPSPYRAGWIYVNLVPGESVVHLHQSYVSVRQSLGSNRRRGRGPATAWTSACGAKTPGSVAPIP